MRRLGCGGFGQPDRSPLKIPQEKVECLPGDHDEASSAAIEVLKPPTTCPSLVGHRVAWRSTRLFTDGFDFSVQGSMIEVRVVGEARDAVLDQHFESASHKHVAQELSFSTNKLPNLERFGRGNLV